MRVHANQLHRMAAKAFEELLAFRQSEHEITGFDTLRSLWSSGHECIGELGDGCGEIAPVVVEFKFAKKASTEGDTFSIRVLNSRCPHFPDTEDRFRAERHFSIISNPVV